VQVPSNAFRTELQLATEPATTGAHAYRVRIDAQPGEAMTHNNVYPLTVNVTADRTRMLILDCRPRWEYRYLKNLFAGRDRTVRLQHVLFHPDRIVGRAERARIPASVTYPSGQTEATALPLSETEWMKFDVIVLGDVAPSVLAPKEIKTLWKFVADRGGTLVVIAGPSYMPHAYAATAIRDLLPVVFDPSERPVLSSPQMQYRIALTAEGRHSIIMRQAVQEEENLRIWNSRPPLYWRHPNVSAKPGATVLAYALGPEPPKYVTAPDGKAGRETPRARRLRRKYQRTRPLIASHNVALGRVMFLAFDRTWRLRYRVGDTYHHKFWGQVLRWGTSGKLPAGTTLVKMGSVRSHYPPNENVRIRAKLVQRDFAPLVSREVAVKVYSGTKLVLRKKMEFVPDSPGMYSVDLGPLPSGSYGAELDAPAARALMEAENVSSVQALFSVDPSTPTEQIELAADRSLLSRLADETGGVVVEPPRAAEVMAALGAPVLVRPDRREITLWDSWPLLTLLIVTVTCEWLLRKKVGLA